MRVSSHYYIQSVSLSWKLCKLLYGNLSNLELKFWKSVSGGGGKDFNGMVIVGCRWVTAVVIVN
jgi:hypothetical protein